VESGMTKKLMNVEYMGAFISALVRPNKKYLCFQLACMPKKPPFVKIFMEHLEKKQLSVLLVLNHENRMKIGLEMAEVRTQNDREIGRLSTF